MHPPPGARVGGGAQIMPGMRIESGIPDKEQMNQRQRLPGDPRAKPGTDHYHIEFQSQPQGVEIETAAPPEGEGKAGRA